MACPVSRARPSSSRIGSGGRGGRTSAGRPVRIPRLVVLAVGFVVLPDDLETGASQRPDREKIQCGHGIADLAEIVIVEIIRRIRGHWKSLSCAVARNSSGVLVS